MARSGLRSRLLALAVPLPALALLVLACGSPESSRREAGSEPESGTSSGTSSGTGRVGGTAPAGDATADPPRPVERLEPPIGRTAEHRIAPGACHRFDLALDAGALLELAIEQRGIDVASTVRTPDGGVALEIDGPIGALGPEEGAFVAEAAGRHALEVCAFDSATAAAPYELRLEVTGAAQGSEGAQGRIRIGARAHLRYFEARRADRAGSADRARALFTEALELWRRAGDRRGQAWALYKLGRIDQRAGALGRAAERFGEAARLHRDLGEPLREAVVLSYRGTMLSEGGRFREALEAHGRTVRLARDTGAVDLERRFLENLAGIHQDLGETFEALDRYRTVRALHREAGDRRGEQVVTARMGKLYREAGDLEAARSMLGESLELARRHGSALDVAEALDDLGRLDLDLESPGSARAHFAEALALKRGLPERAGRAETRGEAPEMAVAVSLNNLGRALRRLGELRRARDALTEALALARSAGRSVYEGLILVNLARLDAAGEEPAHARAAERCRRALEIFREAAADGFAASALRCIAEQELARGRLDDARRAAEESLEIVERMRARTEIDDLRATLLADRRPHFGLLIDVLMALDRERPGAGWSARAFEVAEQSRARTLLDGLRVAEAGQVGEVGEAGEAGEAARETLRSERRLRRAVASLEREIVLRRAAGAPEIETLERRRRELETERELLAARIVRRHPGYAGLFEQRAAGIDAIRSGLLADGETRILAYFLGEERSHVWLVGRDSLRSATLPGEDAICAEAEAARRLLAESDERHKRVPASLATAALAKTVLAPVAEGLDARRIALVTDGCLHGVPFAALPIPAGPAMPTGPPAGDAGRPGERFVPGSGLGETVDLVELPSASSLLVLRRLRRDRPPAPRTLAVIADPVLQPADERLAGSEGPVPAPSLPGAPAAIGGEGDRDGGGRGAAVGVARRFDPDELGRLPGAREEARRLRRTVPPEELFLAVGFDASRETVLDGPLGGYRILHFATHGITDPRFPGLLLSRYDRRGEPRNGFLWAREIYGLDLAADLVVLGSCRSGLGPRLAGEGPLGLSRAFLFAGARTVLVSLWDVDDRATAELMVRFYDGLLARNLPPARALRRAREELRRDERFAAPHYWAGFVVQGDWR